MVAILVFKKGYITSFREKVMSELISERKPIARKDHDCMACEFIFSEGVNGFGYSFQELRIIAKAKKNMCKIKKGDKYINQTMRYEGELYTFKAIPEMHLICLNHDLYC